MFFDKTDDKPDTLPSGYKPQISDAESPKIPPTNENEVTSAAESYTRFNPKMTGSHTAVVVIDQNNKISIKYNTSYEDRKLGKMVFYGGASNDQQCNVYTDNVACIFFDRTQPKGD